MQLVLLRVGHRLHRQVDYRLRTGDGLEADRVRGVAQGIACRRVLQPGSRHNVPGLCPVQALALVGVHAQQARHPLGLAGPGVEYLRACLKAAGVKAQVGKTAALIQGYLEGQSRQWLVRVVVAFNVRFFDRLDAGDGGNISGRWQVRQDRIQQRLDALVVQTGAQQHRHQGAGQGTFAHRAANRLAVQRIAGQIPFQQGIVVLGQRLQHLGPPRLRRLLKGRWNVAGLRGLPGIVSAPGDTLHVDQVDDSLKMFFRSQG